MHINLEENKNGRDYVMGDLHGCYDLFINTLKYEGFRPETDRLISVGDIIDRGPDSEKCLELLDLPWFHMVRGNHEQMMIDAVLSGKDKSWLTHYGRWCANMSENERRDWARRFAALPTAITLDCGAFKVGICHAEPPGVDWSNVNDASSDTQMMWGRKSLRGKPKQNVTGIDMTVHGHTPLEWPAWVGNRYFLDTGAWSTHKLTLRRVRDIWSEYQTSSNLFGL